MNFGTSVLVRTHAHIRPVPVAIELIVRHPSTLRLVSRSTRLATTASTVTSSIASARHGGVNGRDRCAHAWPNTRSYNCYKLKLKATEYCADCDTRSSIDRTNTVLAEVAVRRRIHPGPWLHSPALGGPVSQSQSLGLSRNMSALACDDRGSGPVQRSIQTKLEAEFRPTYLQVINESGSHNVPKGSESHFKVIIIICTSH